MTRSRLAFGAQGEDAAAAWYVANGYQVLARNWRCPEGEIDLVARRGSTVVFCEVKTRRSTAYGAPIEAVHDRKQRRLRVLAAIWLRASGTRSRHLRFDVASVLGDVVEVVESAF